MGAQFLVKLTNKNRVVVNLGFLNSSVILFLQCTQRLNLRYTVKS
jgi:hypothetical protein